jgi:transposase
VVAYLRLDPRVYQSGSAPARSGRISKQGSPRARWALVQAARSVAQQPGPLHAFYERLRGRKSHNAAIVAVARKLAVLFYRMLTREEDYAHQQPSLTAQQLRRLEVRAGAPTLKGTNPGVWATRERMRQAQKQLAAQAEASHKRSVADWQATSPKNTDKAGASVTAGRA